MIAPSLSIVLIVNDVESTLARTVHDLMEFGSEPEISFEVLVIDTGSVDDSIIVATELARQYPQIRICYHPVRGDTELLQMAMRYTRGEYVMVCDGEMTINEVRDLWNLRTKQNFVMVSVFAKQMVVRTTMGDEVIPTEIPPQTHARLFTRPPIEAGARYDLAHTGGRGSMSPVYIHPLSTRAAP